MEEIFKQIEEERDYQATRWTIEGDDKNTLNDWAALINIYLGKAIEYQRTPEEQRKYFLKVAALGVAALEAFDRNKGFPPRHYDDK